MINERFIQFIWQNTLFDKQSLQTVHGEQVRIKNIGFLNPYDGPDFSDSRVIIGEIEWVGTVEIHVTDVDWLLHGHQNDAKYENVILHVVWELKNEEAVPKGIPCLVLKDYISVKLIESYKKLLESSEKLACRDYIEKVSSLDKVYTLEKVAFERLERKRDVLYQIFSRLKFDWNQMLFYLFALALGKKVNKEAMQILAQNVQVKCLLKHADEPKSIEAILFGVSGFLDNSSEYGKELKTEYSFLKHKYSLDEMPKEVWNFSKVRGISRPHLSLALLGSIVVLMSKKTVDSDINESFLNELSLNKFWTKHHNFEQNSNHKNRVTSELLDHLKINVLVPYLTLLAKYYGDESYLYKAQSILENIKAEKNSIVDKMQLFGFEVSNAFTSQASLELHNEYCQKHKCIECHTGKIILGRVV